MSEETKQDQVYIFDTTLRDGEQTPGAKLNSVEKIAIAKQLEKLGVDIIEAGFPISSPEDFKAVETVAKTIKTAQVCALARGLEKDIDVAWDAIKEATNPRIHTFISASDIHIENQMRKSRDEVLKMVEKAVSQAKSHCDNIEFSPMDASRADFDYLVKFIQVAIDNGATTINVPDTVGYAVPSEWGEFVGKLVEAVPAFKKDVILSMHTHNDLGLATANSLVGIENGARQVEATINGIGERAGNSSLEEVAMIINTRYSGKFKTNINTKEISKTSRMVSQLMNMPVQPNKAIVGANAFAHSSGIHQDGIIKHKQNFEIMDPASVGVSNEGILLTARSGRSALSHRLEKLDYNVTKEEINEIYDRFLHMADQKKEVYDEDLHFLMKSEASEQKNKPQNYNLELVQVICGNKNIPTATVTIQSAGKDDMITATATGDGPVDAAFKAIDEVTGKELKLQEYLVQAVTEGMDAQGKVSVKVEHDDKSFYGFGADFDIIVASTKAYIDAVNKIN